MLFGDLSKVKIMIALYVEGNYSKKHVKMKQEVK